MRSSREVDGEDSSLGMRRAIQKMDLKSSSNELTCSTASFGMPRPFLFGCWEGQVRASCTPS
jgi:hypothetical protein